MAQKFVITRDGHLRLGDVALHAHLLEPCDTCIGGGFWQIDWLNGRMVLDGKSYDYGYPRWHLLIGDGVTLRVPGAYWGLSIVYHPDGRYDGDVMVTQELRVEYV